MNVRHPFGNFYKNRRILVTGHTGFKGSWLSIWLTELGAKVTGYSLQPPTKPSMFAQCKLSRHMHSITGDIRDLTKLSTVIESTRPEVVFHLAAQSLVRRSYRDPIETVATNVLGTVNVLEAIRQRGKCVRVCQLITSDKCYANREIDHAYAEEEPMGGHDPYSASKGAAEIMIASFRRSFFSPVSHLPRKISVSSARAGNVIGGGDWSEDRILPDCIRALSRKKPIPVRNPRAIRPWQHVLDALSGYLHLAHLQSTGDAIYADAWNFGPEKDEKMTVADLVKNVIGCWGGGSWIKNKPAKAGTKLHEATLLKLDCRKAEKLLKWRPVYTAEDCIKPTVAWYREACRGKSHFDGFALTSAQIHRYMNTAKRRKILWAV
ncbi:MAG: CDP-glucose 4,6-dehydratase [Candidatus Omnitrophota bacterium]